MTDAELGRMISQALQEEELACGADFSSLPEALSTTPAIPRSANAPFDDIRSRLGNLAIRHLAERLRPGRKASSSIPTYAPGRRRVS